MIFLLHVSQYRFGELHQRRLADLIQLLNALRYPFVESIQEVRCVFAALILVQQLLLIILHGQIPLLPFSVLRTEFTHGKLL